MTPVIACAFEKVFYRLHAQAGDCRGQPKELTVHAYREGGSCRDALVIKCASFVMILTAELLGCSQWILVRLLTLNHHLPTNKLKEIALNHI